MNKGKAFQRSTRCVSNFFGSNLFERFAVGRFALLAFLLLGLVGGVSAFEGGSGTSSDPYQIATCQQLQDMQNDLSASYELVSDVDCSGYSGFSSVGDGANGFTGVLDGQGHVVKNLEINGEGSDYVALIGALRSSGEVKNIGVVNADISSSGDEVAVLVGWNDESTVSNSFSTGTVSGDGFNTGGLVGRISGTVSNSFSKASVSGGFYATGGLAGGGQDLTISNSFSTGTVSGDNSVGGLIGRITSDTYTVSDSYWDITSSGQSSSAGGAGLTTSEMTYPNAESNMAFDFQSVWKFESGCNNDYPFQQVFGEVECNAAPSWDSTGISPDPQLIGEPFDVSYEASDSDGTVASVDVEVFDGSGNLLNSSSRSYSSSSVSDTVGSIWTPEGEGEINVRFTVTDDAGASTTQWLNRSVTTQVTSVDCEINSSFWQNCNQSTTFGNVITRVRAEVYGSTNDVSFTLKDEYDDHYSFQNANYGTLNNSEYPNYYIYNNVDRVIDDSGQWWITANATNSNTDVYNTSWTVPWGSLQVDMLRPGTGIEVQQGNTFNMTGEVTCTGGECASETDGEGGGPETIELWADPRPSDNQQTKIVDYEGRVGPDDSLKCWSNGTEAECKKALEEVKERGQGFKIGQVVSNVMVWLHGVL